MGFFSLDPDLEIEIENVTNERMLQERKIRDLSLRIKQNIDSLNSPNYSFLFDHELVYNRLSGPVDVEARRMNVGVSLGFPLFYSERPDNTDGRFELDENFWRNMALGHAYLLQDKETLKEYFDFHQEQIRKNPNGKISRFENWLYSLTIPLNPLLTQANTMIDAKGRNLYMILDQIKFRELGEQLDDKLPFKIEERLKYLPEKEIELIKTYYTPIDNEAMTFGLEVCLSFLFQSPRDTLQTTSKILRNDIIPFVHDLDMAPKDREKWVNVTTFHKKQKNDHEAWVESEEGQRYYA